MPVAFLLVVVMSFLTQSASAPLQAQAQAAAAALDYDYFKTKVQPIFSATRAGHTRCASCHMHGTSMRLVEMAKGATAWTEEQTKKNFQIVSARVIPRQVMNSRLLVHPLAWEGGGTFYHTGGKHFDTIYNTEWQTIANWACGVKANEKTWLITAGGCPEEMH